MVTRTWILLSTLLVIAGCLTGYLTGPKYPTVTKPANTLTQARILDYARQGLQSGQVVNKIHVIHVTKLHGQYFVFASYKLSEKLKYISMAIDAQGAASSTFSVGGDWHRTPIQSVTLGVGKSEYITGVTAPDTVLKSVVIVFKDGSTASVPVQNHDFWYVHPTATYHGAEVNKVIGITSQGNIITNQSA